MTMQKYAALLAKLRNVYITSLKGVVIPKTICSPIYLPLEYTDSMK